MRVLITGGRDFADRTLLFDLLDRLHADRSFTLLIHGAASFDVYLMKSPSHERRAMSESS